MTENSAPSLDKLDTFGDVAAEDDAVLKYFLSTNAVKSIEENSAFLVLGRKGAGKTALVRHFTEGNGHALSRALNLRGYPWNVHSQRKDAGASDIEAYVSSWAYLIAIELSSLVLSLNPSKPYDSVRALQEFLQANYGGTNPALSEILQPGSLKVGKFTIQPSVMGVSLGGVEFNRGQGDVKLGLELNALTNSILNEVVLIAQFNEMGRLIIHFDELDQGLSEADENRKKMLIGLILGARMVQRRQSDLINPVVYLRSDLWDDLQFSDKNKISQTNSLNLEWNSESLLALVNVRLGAKLGEGVGWDQINDENLMRGSQTKWSHILGRTFLRPRDVIKFLNIALSVAQKRADRPLIFVTEDIRASREEYSAYLKKELDDEILPHWPRWEEALQALSAISTITFTRDQFTEEYNKRKTQKNSVSPDDALALLYRFSVIGYTKRSGFGGSGWAFQYTDPAAGWDNGATSFKVHQGLKEYARLREARRE